VESKPVQPPDTVNAPPPESGISSKVSFLPPAILNVPAELPQSPAVSSGGPPPSVTPAQRPDPPLTPSLEAPYTPPVIVTKVMPAFPPALKSVIFKRKTVSVKLQIDEKGRVTSAEAYPSKEWTPQAITTAAIQAARLWKFKPAMRAARPVAGEAMVEFVFDPPR
jgi:TonB family protein